MKSRCKRWGNWLLKEHEETVESAAIEIRECLTPGEIAAAYPVMHQLRESLDLDAYLYRVGRARTQGYRLFCGLMNERIVAAIGLRLQDDLCWGRNLYVDDLVVDDEYRGRRIGEAMMRHAEKLARAEDCQYVRLASGINRTRTHRFYERIGYRKSSFAFAFKLQE